MRGVGCRLMNMKAMLNLKRKRIVNVGSISGNVEACADDMEFKKLKDE